MFSKRCHNNLQGLLALALLLVPLLALSDDIADPTRPLFLQKKKVVVVPKKKAVAVPYASEKTTPPEVFTLTSTLISKQRTIAVINDHVVSIGDKVGGATVVAIESAQVRLRKGTRDITLPLAAQKTRAFKKVLRGQAVIHQQRLP